MRGCRNPHTQASTPRQHVGGFDDGLRKVANRAGTLNAPTARLVGFASTVADYSDRETLCGMPYRRHRDIGDGLWEI
jgi:hypothetical protein